MWLACTSAYNISAPDLEEVHFHLNKLGLHLPLSLAEQKLLLKIA